MSGCRILGRGRGMYGGVRHTDSAIEEPSVCFD